MIIAVDGPAASGKGTLARRLAAHYDLAYLDTGALYRAVARDVLAVGGDLRDSAGAAEIAKALDPETLDDPELRLRGTGEAASVVAQFQEVREALVVFQRSFARKTAWRRARRAGHRHRDMSRCRCEDLCGGRR